MRHAARLVLPLLLSACAATAAPRATGSTPAAAAPASALSGPLADIDPNDVTFLEQQLNCTSPSQQFVGMCLAIGAFREGHAPKPAAELRRPGWGAGVSLPGAKDAGQPPMLGLTYLVLAPEMVRFGTVVPANAQDLRDIRAVSAALGNGGPLPAAAVNSAMALIQRVPLRDATAVVGQSLVYGGDARGWIRETPIGLVVIERISDEIDVAYFPHVRS
jgi:hypothetical protein